MRSPLPRLAPATIVGLLLAACAPAASPSPVAVSPSPSGSPAPSPSGAATPSPTSTPVAIDPANEEIAAGYGHTCAVTTGGGLRCWGANVEGQLGNGTATDVAVPGVVDVSGLASGVVAVAAGGFHTCALTSAGGVKCWGDNLYGQLGDGANADSSTPVNVSGLSSGVIAISAGWSHTCALTSEGGVRCWGHNHFGWLGDGTTTDRNTPVGVTGLSSGITAIASGTLHTCAVRSGGGVTCWGYGQSDDPTVFTSHVPVDVPDLGAGVIAITASLDRTCALTIHGGITCWGPNYAPPPGESLPERMYALDVSRLAGVAAVASSESNVCALTIGGAVACTGRSRVLEAVPALAEGARGIAVGGQHACASKSGGAVVCWGSNVGGQLGSITRCQTTSIPVAVPPGPGAVTPSPGSEPYVLPSGRIDHPTGPTDVVLRFDRGPDVAVGDLVGDLFQAGPEFTLYGDGTVIFRDERTQPPPAEGAIVRGRPFMIGRLDEDAVQSLLRFALGDGGLGDACERYEVSGDTDAVGSVVLTVRAGDLDKRVEISGENPLGALLDRLAAFDPGPGVATRVWVGERYRGNLFEAGSVIDGGGLPRPPAAEIAAWPWPGIRPADFTGAADGGAGRRVFSAEEAAVLGLSDNGGVVQRIYLRAPDGEALYYLSLWPMSPDETE